MSDQVSEQNVLAQDANQKPSTAQDAGGKTYSEEYVKGLRQEAAKHRTEANDLAKQLGALQDSMKSETEKMAEKAALADKLTPEVDALRKALQDEIEAQKTTLSPEILSLMPNISPAEQLGWIRKAKEASEKLKPSASLPPAGGRNPANGTQISQELQSEATLKNMRARIPALGGLVPKG